MREKVEYKQFTDKSKYTKDHADRLMNGWDVVDSDLVEKAVFVIWWAYFIKGWIIYEKK